MNTSYRSLHSAASSGSAQSSALRSSHPQQQQHAAQMTLTVAPPTGGGASGGSGSFVRVSGGGGGGGGQLSVHPPDRKSYIGGTHLMSGPISRATKSRLGKASVVRRRGRKSDHAPVLKDGKDVTPLQLMPRGRGPTLPSSAAAGGASSFVPTTSVGGAGPSRGISQMITGLSSALSMNSKSSAGLTTMAALFGSGSSKEDEGTQVRSVFGSAPGMSSGPGGLHPQSDDAAYESSRDFRLEPPPPPLLERIIEEERFVKPKRKYVPPAVLSVKIEETPTMTLLHIPGIRVSGEDVELAKRITEENKRYQEMLERHKERDKYVTRGMQTLTNTLRNKRVQHVSEGGRSVGQQATVWDIYDETQKEEAEADAKAAEEEAASGARSFFSNAVEAGTQTSLEGIVAAVEAKAKLSSGGSDGGSSVGSPRRSQSSYLSGSEMMSSYLSSSFGGLSSPASGASSAVPLAYDPLAHLLRKPTFSRALAVLEQAVVQNELHKEQLLYRDHPSILPGASSSARRPPHLDTGAEEGEEEGGGAEEEVDPDVLAALPPASAFARQQQHRPSFSSTSASASSVIGSGRKQQQKRRPSRSLTLTRTDEIETIVLEDEVSQRREAAEEEEEEGERKGEGEEEEDDSEEDEELTDEMLSEMAAGELKQQRPDAAIMPLWTFECGLTKGLSALCLAFNKENKDLLAVGYGSAQFGKVTNGLILFWSLKNPRYPHKALRTKHSVTSLEFSGEHANLLAAGMYDGSVCIYDMAGELTEKPTYESDHATGKHSDPVWGLKWVAKDSHRSVQHLISISSDGTVQQWDMKKGLVPHELMSLKRVPNKAHFITQQTGQLEGRSRDASGLCFDFPINDATQYFVGTEDGIIQKCSVSYNEQVLDTFYGHTAPIYKVRCSPFHADAFLSCSADWTCALWSQKQPVPLLKFISGHDYVVDVDWSPTNACVFASVSRDGRLEIWDLEYSPLDPVVRYRTDKELTCVIFSPNAPVVFTGCKDGTIDVFRIDGVELTGFPVNPEEQAVRLADAMFEAGRHEGPREMVTTIGSVSNTPRMLSP